MLGLVTFLSALPIIRNGLAQQPDNAVILNLSENIGGHLTLSTSGKWQNPVLATETSNARKLKANPLLKVDVSVPPDADDSGWFQVKLAIHGENLARTESPKWLLNRAPRKAGIEKATLSWDTSAIVANMPANANWFKIQLITQGDRPRAIDVSNLRCENVGGSTVAEPNTNAVTATSASPTGPVPYPKNAADWPGKGVIRSFDFMAAERNAFWTQREKDKGAVVFTGDSLIGGWKTVAKDFSGIKVANRGIGGDVSRGVLFRFQEDVLDLNPRAVVIEIGSNDLTAIGKPADILSNLKDIVAKAEKEKPGMPIVLCSIPPSANPKAPIKTEDRRAVNEGIAKLTSEYPNTRFCDLYSALANEDGAPRSEYFAADQLHISRGGYEKWAELLTPILEKLNSE